MSNLSKFIHLRVHTEYSLLEGAVKVKGLADLCHNFDMPAMAITDTNNLFAALEFSVTASGAGIQPIIGCQMDVAYSGFDCKDKAPLCGPMVFLAQDKQGYENLLKLNTCLYVDKKGQRPHLTNEEIKHHSDGLICLTGGAEGPVGQLICASQTTAGKSLLMTYAEVF